MDWNIPVVQQNTLMGELAKIGELKGRQQQQRLIDMKLEQAPEELAMQRESHKATMANNQAQADEAGLKAQGQKAMLAKNVATTILKRVSASGIQPGTPEFQEALNAAGNPYRGMMSQIFGHQDEGKPMDYSALQSLANYEGLGAEQKVIYSQQHAADGEYKFNGVTGEVEPIMHGGKQLHAAQYSPQLQGDIAAQKENAKIDQVTLSDGRKVPMRMGSAVSDGRSSAPPQFDISADASPEDRAILEKMQAQTGGTSAPVTLGQSTAAEAEAKKSAESTATRENDAKGSIDILRNAAPLIGDSTSSGIGSLIDKGMSLFGASTKGADTAAALKVLGGQLVSKMPKMSGPQSDKDVLLYKEMAGQIGDPTIPTTQKRAAMNMIMDMNKKYSGREEGPLNFDKKAAGPEKVKFLGFE